jgi:Abi-like protein
MRDARTNAALERSFSRERLGKYLTIAAGDLDRAIGLYEHNMRLSEAFYVPLQSLEVCLRNHLNNHLADRFGENWLTDPTAAPLEPFGRRLIAEAQNEIAGLAAPGKIVAEVKFAFWVGLVAQRYDATIWRFAAFRAFTARGGQKRKIVHGRLNAIRRFRNRVAHHEPIFQADPARMHNEILEAIGWICPQTEAWSRANSRVSDVLETLG